MPDYKRGREMQRRRAQVEREKAKLLANHPPRKVNLKVVEQVIEVLSAPYRPVRGEWIVTIDSKQQALHWRKAKKLINKGIAKMT